MLSETFRVSGVFSALSLNVPLPGIVRSKYVKNSISRAVEEKSEQIKKLENRVRVSCVV